MSKFLLIFIFGFSIVAHAVEYRSFTDKEGREIKAKIIKVNKGAKKVTLERENKKKATVAINIFSEADQKYIEAWSPFNKDEEKKTGESESNQATLSKAYMREIAENYLLIIGNPKKEVAEEHRDYFMPIVKSERGRTLIIKNGKEGTLSRTGKIKAIQGNNVLITITDNLFDLGYLQLTDDGKFKYDGIFCPHPIHEAFLEYEGLESLAEIAVSPKFDRLKHEKPRFTRLCKLGIPTFDYSLDLNPNRKARELKKIKEWLLDHGKDWDNSDPKTPLPEDVFDILYDRYRYR